jgi:hypothetical protein
MFLKRSKKNVYISQESPTRFTRFPKKNRRSKKKIDGFFSTPVSTNPSDLALIHSFKMSATIETLSVDQILAAVADMSVDDRFSVMEHCLKLLRKETKGLKAKKVKDPNAPKKEANWFMKGSQDVIRPALKDKFFDAATNTWKDEALKLQPSFTKIAGILKADGHFTPEKMPTPAQVIAAYNKWKAIPSDAKTASTPAPATSTAAPKKADAPATDAKATAAAEAKKKAVAKKASA